MSVPAGGTVDGQWHTLIRFAVSSLIGADASAQAQRHEAAAELLERAREKIELALIVLRGRAQP